MAFMRNISAGYVLFCRTKENQKGRRCPEGMKAPVGLLSRRPVCGANAACSAQQGHSDFDALDPTGCGPPASASCLERHSHPAGRCPNSSSLYPPLAAVVAVANKGLLALDNPKAEVETKKCQPLRSTHFFFFRFSDLQAPQSLRDSSPQGSGCSRYLCLRHDPSREYKNNFSTDYGQSARGGHFK